MRDAKRYALPVWFGLAALTSAYEASAIFMTASENWSAARQYPAIHWVLALPVLTALTAVAASFARAWAPFVIACFVMSLCVGLYIDLGRTLWALQGSVSHWLTRYAGPALLANAHTLVLIALTFALMRWTRPAADQAP